MNINERCEHPERISWRIHERDLARLEKAYRTALVILAVALAVAVAFAFWESHMRHVENQRWIEYINEYDFESYQQDGEGVNIIGSMNGVDYNGAARPQENQEEPIVRAGNRAEEKEEVRP